MSDYRWRVDAASTGLRLDKFLAESPRLGSRSRAGTALERGKVFVNGDEATPADAARRLAEGDEVRLWMDRPGSARKRTLRAARKGELSIVYQDDAVVVVNKPAGLLAVPLERQEDAASVEDELHEHLRSRGRRRPFVVHRIDRDTSGLVVFATRADAQARLKDQFRRREPARIYLAVVYGRPTPPSGTWHDYLAWDQRSLIQKETDAKDPRAKEARCQYRVLEQFSDAALIEVRLVTGRRNQIRLQARLRGHTLVGEQRYTYGAAALRPIEFPRQALHAWRLEFRHPVDGRPLAFEAPIPADMDELLANLRKNRPAGGNPFQGRRSLIK
jgi:23S rRNA pseudouridine1911/1915/1917 synthase